MYIDLNQCTRWLQTESNLGEVVSEVANVLRATGVEVNVQKLHVQSEEQARELGFISSPTIRLNGKDIQLEVKESLCESCGEIAGENIDCRVWIWQGQEYTAPPKGMIIEAILQEVYGGAKEQPQAPPTTRDVPDNLKRFFAAKQKANQCCW
jgi:hypothetical protein